MKKTKSTLLVTIILVAFLTSCSSSSRCRTRYGKFDHSKYSQIQIHDKITELNNI